MGSEDGRGERVQLLLSNRFALVDFLQGRVGSQHAVEDVLEAVPVDHGLVGPWDLDLTFSHLHAAIGGAGARRAVEHSLTGLAIFHDAA
ncbi:hypothetical protein D3C77_550690 [compost metagenome]